MEVGFGAGFDGGEIGGGFFAQEHAVVGVGLVRVLSRPRTFRSRMEEREMSSTSWSFSTRIELGGKTATGFRVPADVVEAMGDGKKPKVVVTVNGHSYRSTVAVYGGVAMLPLSAENRRPADVEAGDTVTVALERDTAERRVEVPGELATALDSSPGARAAFEALSYSKQRERVDAVRSAKRAETRVRRIAGIIAGLVG
ncbi:YdeI/OmpD-associated family protein [Nocardia sp. NPDC059177]|uniref:YdeI/OmpD-associated family protein n=1 Tax=Nocardia sp. NPDC059177 TaxID=3346759 RepID=UPI0036865624